MELKDYITFDENGKAVIDEKRFNADLDRERNSASETARNNYDKKTRPEIEKAIREQIEADAKKSAEELLAEREAKLLAEQKAFNKTKIKAIYLKDGLYDEEEAESLSDLIGDDYAAAEARATKLVENRRKSNETYKAKILAEIQSGQGNPDGQGNGGQSDSYVINRAKMRNKEANKTERIEF